MEAKCREEKVGIQTVRNAVGILNDINQKFPDAQKESGIYKRYTYCFVIFSTSGFSKTAANMALAHQISLVDLSGPNFDDLRTFTNELSEIIYYNILIENENTKYLLRLIRFHIRKVLNTWPDAANLPDELEELYHTNMPAIEQITNLLHDYSYRYNEYFVGMVNGPFLIIFKPDNSESFLEYASKYPNHSVTITWDNVTTKQISMDG